VPPKNETFDLSISLDVIYHLIEDDVYHRYMTQLFAASREWVVIFAGNFDQAEADIRAPMSTADHVHHRRFSDWIQAYAVNWALVDHRENPYPWVAIDPSRTSFADFYVYHRNARM
jgi:hypothetical protein